MGHVRRTAAAAAAPALVPIPIPVPVPVPVRIPVLVLFAVLASVLLGAPASAAAAAMTQHDRDNARTRIDMSGLDLGSMSARAAAEKVADLLTATTRDRLADLYGGDLGAASDGCRRKVGEHLGLFVNAVGAEGGMPFQQEQFYSECAEEKYDFDYLPEGVGIQHIQNRTYRPPRTEAEYLDDPGDLRLLYAILTHADPDATVRLIEALHEDGHTFVVHVDGKEGSDATHAALASYASTRDHVHVLDRPHRVRANWGGFSLVNATLQILRYSLAHEGYPTPEGKPLPFHRIVHMASTTYPLKSNAEIRRRLASYPLDANFVDVVFKPLQPDPENWSYFVECDDALHRIYRLTPLDDMNWGIDMYTSSQWFVISREFAAYVAEARPGTLVHDLLEYMEHVVVADETFFGTALRHSEFCDRHHNDNFLHVQFDRWENELNDGTRDPRKCVMRDPNHCGRSPTTMTMDYLPVLEMAGDLFARKFDDKVDRTIKDVIDATRAREGRYILDHADGPFDVPKPPSKVDTSFEGHGVLIVARETVAAGGGGGEGAEEPLCLGLGPARNRVRLYPCFQEGVSPTLAPQWETGAVIVEETLPHNRWEIGPCSSDGDVRRIEGTAELNVTRGLHAEAGPRCLLRQMDGLRKGRCVDFESERLKPGGKVHVFPCVKRWNQFVSFGSGSGSGAPRGSIYSSVPLHIQHRIQSKGRTQEAYMCLAVSGRGRDDEGESWAEDENVEGLNAQAGDNETLVPDAEDLEQLGPVDGKLPLRLWSGKQLVSVPCSDADAVIEWLYVPFILEEEDIEFVGEAPSGEGREEDEEEDL